MFSRFILVCAAVAFTTISVQAQNTTVRYFMNDATGGDVGRTATLTGPLGLVPSTFGNTGSPTVTTGTDINVGPFTTSNDAQRYASGAVSFTFSVTVPAGPEGWEINNYGFDVRTIFAGTYALFLDNNGSGFIQVANGNVDAAGNNVWREVADTITPSLIIFPGNTVQARLDFAGFTGQFDVDAIFLRGAANISTVPEPATIALLGATGMLGAASVWIRRRKVKNLLDGRLSK